HYNALNQQTAITDAYGNDTLFFYDIWGRKVEERLPASEQGIHPRILTSYGILDDPIELISENGNKTIQRFNIRGQLVYRGYPDGTSESYRYSLAGLLLEKIACNEVKKVYAYDAQKRVIEEKTFDRSGNLISEEQWTYNTFHLLAHT